MVIIMAEWIHVVSETHFPTLLGSALTPFKFYQDGFDPNEGDAFGQSYATMYLPVLRPMAPEVDPVLYQVLQTETAGTNGAWYPGSYVAPNWVVGWQQVPQELSASQEAMVARLNTARDLRVNQGYELNGGHFTFPLTDDFLRLMQSRRDWLRDAVNSMVEPPTTEILFSDLTDRQVSFGLTTLNEHVVIFGRAFLAMNATYVAAMAAIRAAESAQEVAAVTWSF